MKTTATITDKGTLLSALANKYMILINSGIMEEKQINSFFSFLNNKATKEEREELTQLMWNREDSILLNQAQNNKGINFLRNLYQTPTGKERVNNPFGYREIAIINNFDRFELIGEYNAGNYGHNYFIPLYRVIGNGTSMEYYYNGGKIHIIG